MGVHEKGPRAMKYRQMPGVWREVSLAEGPGGEVRGIRFGAAGLDLETESAYQQERWAQRRFRLRGRRGTWEI